MAATISINFANEQEVYDESIDTVVSRSKKSVSAKLLQDVLGGGVVSGGYVRKTGDAMTGFLTLTSLPPTDAYHAATKSYVDSHAYTRRYYYKVQTSTQYNNGLIKPGTKAISGIDLYTNPLYFFDKDDTSVLGITRYLDVYRDGILQLYGANNDYIIRDIPTTVFQRGVTAIEFNQPLLEGTNIQVNIGNVGAYPVTFGVNFLSGTYGVASTALSGDVILSAVPIHFSAERSEVATPVRRDVFVSPATLSAFPLMPRAKGLFKKDLAWNTQSFPKEFIDPFGSSNGFYVKPPGYSYNIESVQSDPNGVGSPGLHRAVIKNGILESTLYTPIVNIGLQSALEVDDNAATGYILSESKTLTSFDFVVLNNIFNVDPNDIFEINILVI